MNGEGEGKDAVAKMVHLSIESDDEGKPGMMDTGGDAGGDEGKQGTMKTMHDGHWWTQVALNTRWTLVRTQVATKASKAWWLMIQV